LKIKTPAQKPHKICCIIDDTKILDLWSKDVPLDENKNPIIGQIVITSRLELLKDFVAKHVPKENHIMVEDA
jgi:hypothetical protein